MVMFWFSLLIACEATPSSGSLFAPAPVVAPAEVAAAPAVDPRFAPVVEEVFKISSEEMAAGGSTPVPEGEVMGGDGPEAATVSPAPAPALSSPEVLPATMRFPVRLLSTLPQAQPPRAVLGLPDGKEVVVSPGSVLGTEGLVVMAVMAGRVQLAVVTPAGDHAVIQSLELSAQYP